MKILKKLILLLGLLTAGLNDLSANPLMDFLRSFQAHVQSPLKKEQNLVQMPRRTFFDMLRDIPKAITETDEEQAKKYEKIAAIVLEKKYEEYKKDKESFLSELYKDYPFLKEAYPYLRNLLIISKAKRDPSLLQRPYVRSIYDGKKDFYWYMDQNKELATTESLRDFFEKYVDLSYASVRDFSDPDLLESKDQLFWERIYFSFDKLKGKNYQQVEELAEQKIDNYVEQIDKFLQHTDWKSVNSNSFWLKYWKKFSLRSSTITEFIQKQLQALVDALKESELERLKKIEAINSERQKTSDIIKQNLFWGWLKRCKKLSLNDSIVAEFIKKEILELGGDPRNYFFNEENATYGSPAAYGKFRGKEAFYFAENFLSSLSKKEAAAVFRHEWGHKILRRYALNYLFLEDIRPPLFYGHFQNDESRADLYAALCGKKYNEALISLDSCEPENYSDKIHPLASQRVILAKKVCKSVVEQEIGEDALGRLKKEHLDEVSRDITRKGKELFDTIFPELRSTRGFSDLIPQDLSGNTGALVAKREQCDETKHDAKVCKKSNGLKDLTTHESAKKQNGFKDLVKSKPEDMPARKPLFEHHSS
ncbi:TPA: hypothetical protein DEO28_04205 [Candidatus Dependentiae bacterium]|nr:MAG: hypothetical protein UR14_C0006G0077 [candidate division TM6 bacterium GW2011_GWE2_31_21]KKP53500.1 MAG: hypothetical protein UR43_C0004G0041 [candidate division TM6 bacterium GW2011_GWF2_33_332]HBS48260.1 hypothetical protein [Candidatus Dependentiae bacterium]HBZ73686.1 hypothetical protein [Candidatus Dependentiae bacterium]